MTEPKYVIKERFNTEKLKVEYSIWGLSPREKLYITQPVPHKFETLDEAKEVVRMLIKYENPITHYVE